jgi:hypothetical protein
MTMTNAEKIITLRGEEYTHVVERDVIDGKQVVYFVNGYENYPEPMCYLMGVDGTLFTIGGALVTATMLESLKNIYRGFITKECCGKE